MTNFYLPTYEECVLFCQKNPEGFYENIHTVDGRKVSLFNYLRPEMNQFTDPLNDQSGKTAFELRGLTFVHNDDGSKSRFILLHKFFNLNQVESYQYSLLKDEKIIRVQDKADGSVIRFIPINGKLYAKSKMSFITSQALISQKLLEQDDALKSFVQSTIDMGLSAIFEFVSPSNQIVLRYETTELLLLQLRDERTGDYLDIYDNELVKKHKIKTVKQEETFSWDECLQRQKDRINVEGDIITLSNNMMIKLKTDWYFANHGLVTDSLTRENLIVELVMKDQMDDVMSKVGVDDQRYKNCVIVMKALNHNVVERIHNALNIAKDLAVVGNRADWFKKHTNDADFKIATFLVKKSDENEWFELAKKVIEQDIIKQCYRLSDAKDYLKKLGVELVHIPELMEND